MGHTTFMIPSLYNFRSAFRRMRDSGRVEGSHHVGVCKGTRTIEEFFCKNACLLLCLKKAKDVFLDLPQPLLVHVSTSDSDYTGDKER